MCDMLWWIHHILSKRNKLMRHVEHYHAAVFTRNIKEMKVIVKILLIHEEQLITLMERSYLDYHNRETMVLKTSNPIHWRNISKPKKLIKITSMKLNGLTH